MTELKHLVPLMNITQKANRAMLITGPAGVGKSDMTREFAKKFNLHEETLLLGNQEVGDLIGIPTDTIADDGTKVTTWSRPIWLNRIWEAANKGQHSVLFLDELNRAQTDVKGSALQIVLEGKIHEHELPVVNGIKTVVIAAQNPSDDGNNYQVDELDPALNDRFLHVEVEADADAWLAWARENGVNQIVIDYISKRSEHIYNVPNDVKDKRWCTPRSLTALSDFLNVGVPDELLSDVCIGLIGKGVAAEFEAYYHKHVDIISLEKLVTEARASYNDTNNIEETGKYMKTLLDTQEESIIKERAMMLFSSLTTESTLDEMIPLFGVWYGLNIEVLQAVILEAKDDLPRYIHLAKLDGELNNKNLFKRIAV